VRACEGLELVLQHSQFPIIIDTDCVQIVTVVQDRQLDRSPLLHLVSEIKRLSFLDRVCKFVRVDCSQVRVSPDIMFRVLELERLVTLSK
jgi:hypothetical protein